MNNKKNNFFHLAVFQRTFMPAIIISALLSSPVLAKNQRIYLSGTSHNLEVFNEISEQDCVIEPSAIVDVGSPVSGVINEILVDRTSPLVKGQKLAQLESSVEKAALELALTRANQNTAVELRKQHVKFGELTQKRNQVLQSRSLISLQEMDELSQQTKLAELELQFQEENKQLAWLEFLKAKAVLARNIIVSPIEGVVVEKYMSVGEYVELKPIFRLAQLNPLHVEVILPAEYYGKIKPGMYGEISPFVVEERPYYAKVELVDSVIDAASSTFGVRLTLPNPEHKIPAGMRCKINFMQSLNKQEFTENKDGTNAQYSADLANIKKTAKDKILTDTSGDKSLELLTITEGNNSKKKPPMCYQIGVFNSASQSNIVQKSLKTKLDEFSIDYSLHAKEEAHSMPFYMLIDKASISKEEYLISLKTYGITDFQILKVDKQTVMVSLGYFKSLSAAKLRQSKLQEFGITPTIVEKNKQNNHYWLDLTIANNVAELNTKKYLRSILPKRINFMAQSCQQSYSLK